MAKAKISNRRRKKIGGLVFLSGFATLLLAGTTFAWFIGMRTVNVSSFDVEIATTDSLLLSFDGEVWDTTVSISESTLVDKSYATHTNSWGGEGLIPLSSVGVMSATTNRMELYEKASLTATPGGYRLMASQVDNSGAVPDGYVVFDLFIKNFSGNQYIEALEPLDEEAIYLSTDSTVDVALDGGVENTGIENSVRVAFGQVGRVIATQTDAAIITGITCTNDEVNDVTGICRTASIWEPNDKDHVANAIRWYDTSCVARTGANITLDASYSGSCGTVANGTAYPTYAINSTIASSDNVDVYDGLEYNTYTSTTKLTAFDCISDTDKNLTGVNRPTFMTLAPNSITKVRVYIYIEGQDVDNYDFASIGKKISVNFGLTKERFTETDILYDGPELNNPSITLLGLAAMSVPNGGPYSDPGATAWDSLDGDITGDIVVGGDTVDVNTPAVYTVTYDVTDSDGNAATQVTRTVTVQP